MFHPNMLGIDADLPIIEEVEIRINIYYNNLHY